MIHFPSLMVVGGGGYTGMCLQAGSTFSRAVESKFNLVRLKKVLNRL